MFNFCSMFEGWQKRQGYPFAARNWVEVPIFSKTVQQCPIYFLRMHYQRNKTINYEHWAKVTLGEEKGRDAMIDSRRMWLNVFFMHQGRWSCISTVNDSGSIYFLFCAFWRSPHLSIQLKEKLKLAFKQSDEGSWTETARLYVCG